MSWEKQPAIANGGPACLCCGTPTDMFELDRTIAVGFGAATVTKDGRAVYDEPMIYINEDGSTNEDDLQYWTGHDAEKAAAAEPDHDWRICLFAPLYDAEYQRHAEGQWVLIKRGEGFA